MAEKVVKLIEITPSIVQISMEDRVNKNAFSEQLIQELHEVYQIINKTDHYKVAVLTGFDGYFSSGGTKDSLLSLYHGKAKFTDINIYRLPLDCPIPVVAAMQGHGIGGGFVMGLYCDFAVLSRESIYTTNFMKYGFTPGMGATYILPKKIGLTLSQEMLMSARTYRGSELQQRGIPYAVHPRKDVLNHAHELAEHLAQKPKGSLVILKDHLVRDIRDNIDHCYQAEVSMHEKTFHCKEVEERIQDLYGHQ